jgi:hypothetical protein
LKTALLFVTPIQTATEFHGKPTPLEQISVIVSLMMGAPVMLNLTPLWTVALGVL